jgi:hypothetical protein
MKKPSAATRCVAMTGPDERMDHVGARLQDANQLPVQCQHCTFPDLDFVPKAYLLARGTASPAETAPARLGNFLVRDRIKNILEVIVPGACAFFPTADHKTHKPTPWWLAVPKARLRAAMPAPKAPFCSKCKRPKVWGPLMGPVWAKMTRFDSEGVDIFKDECWFSRATKEDDFDETNRYRLRDKLDPLPWSHWNLEPPPHPERWTRRGIDRELYFSVRLEQLFKRAKVKGQLVRLLCFDEVKTSPADEAWIAEKLELLVRCGLMAGSKPTGKKSDDGWFAQFLKESRTAGRKPVDFIGIEARHKLKLPRAYKDFISAVGPTSFEDINETEGFVAGVLPPAKLDFKNYRRGKLKYLSDEDSQIDGVMFADTGHGDCFVFDVAASGDDYPVYWYNHENNSLEPFAPNFAGCIKRFVEKN